jgi:hypothetical protein
MFKSKKMVAARRELFIKTASKYVGYTSGPLMTNAFGQRVGYDSQPWAGAFIDVVARECGLSIPACTYTGNGLSEAIRSGLLVRNPQPGDLVFFNFSSESNSSFAMLHLGIVTDVKEWKSTARFLTIEGNINNGLRYNEQKDGVFTKVRHVGDVLAFVRPAELKRFDGVRPGQLLTNVIKLFSKESSIESAQLAEAAAENKQLKIESLKPGLRNRSIELVQLALSVTVGLRGAQRGTWDASTQHAYAKWQRNVGYVGAMANGIPDEATLRRLAASSKLFTIA